MTLIEIIEARLTSLGWSRAELSRRLGVAPPRITEWLSGKRDPGASKFDAMIDAMGGLSLHAGRLVWGDPDKPKRKYRPPQAA